MKMIALLSTLLVSTQAFSMSYRYYCSGNQGKVSLSIYSSEDKIFMRYTNALGALDFPFYEGTVTKASMPYIKIAEKELASIDHEVVVSWPLSKCEFNEENHMLMNCNGEATFVVPADTKLASYTLTTTMVHEESQLYSYDMAKVRWGIEGESFHHSLAMPFDANKCMAQYVK